MPSVAKATQCVTLCQKFLHCNNYDASATASVRFTICEERSWKRYRSRFTKLTYSSSKYYIVCIYYSIKLKMTHI